MSREHRPIHKNRWTGEILLNKEQVCSGCHLNFGTTEDGDAHRVGTFGVDRKCVQPSTVGLIPIENKYQSLVWRAPEWM